jgi:hypothetical protein
LTESACEMDAGAGVVARQLVHVDGLPFPGSLFRIALSDKAKCPRFFLAHVAGAITFLPRTRSCTPRRVSGSICIGYITIRAGTPNRSNSARSVGLRIGHNGRLPMRHSESALVSASASTSQWLKPYSDW